MIHQATQRFFLIIDQMKPNSPPNCYGQDKTAIDIMALMYKLHAPPGGEQDHSCDSNHFRKKEEYGQGLIRFALHAI